MTDNERNRRLNGHDPVPDTKSQEVILTDFLTTVINSTNEYKKLLDDFGMEQDEILSDENSDTLFSHADISKLFRPGASVLLK